MDVGRGDAKQCRGVPARDAGPGARGRRAHPVELAATGALHDDGHPSAAEFERDPLSARAVHFGAQHMRGAQRRMARERQLVGGREYPHRPSAGDRRLRSHERRLGEIHLAGDGLHLARVQPARA